MVGLKLLLAAMLLFTSPDHPLDIAPLAKSDQLDQPGESGGADSVELPAGLRIRLESAIMMLC